MKQATIEVYETMISRKRGAGAYLRKNLLTSDEEGIYPAKDFVNKKFGTDPEADEGYLIKNDYVFIDDGGTSKVYQNSLSGDLVFKANMPDNSPPKSVVETDETNKVFVLLQNGKLYSVENTTINLIHDFGVSATSSHMVYNGFSWYISINKQLFQLLPTLVPPTVVKTTTADAQTDIVNMQIFNGYIVMVRKLGWFVQFDFWDIAEADIDLYQKRVVEKNCRHLGFGDVDGTLIFVKAVGNSSNTKEKHGDIVVSAFDGEKFVKLNSIRAWDDGVTTSGGQPQSIGNGVMILAIGGNYDANKTLGKDWVLKIKNNGAIETIFEPKDITDGSSIRALNIEYSYVSILLEKSNGKAYFYHNKDTQTAYADYPDYTTAEYITNFLNNNKNVHELLSFGVSFEKVFEQMSGGETLYIDYRTSERDDWTLLQEIDTEKIKDYASDKLSEAVRQAEYASDTTGQTVQSYVITKMPDNSALPRYNEIQFRFRMENGFSIMKAWYNYDYLIRNTA